MSCLCFMSLHMKSLQFYDRESCICRPPNKHTEDFLLVFRQTHRAYSVLQLNTHFFSSLFFYTYMSGFSGAELHVEDTHEDEVKPGVVWFRTAVKQAGIFSTLSLMSNICLKTLKSQYLHKMLRWINLLKSNQISL